MGWDLEINSFSLFMKSLDAKLNRSSRTYEKLIETLKFVTPNETDSAYFNYRVAMSATVFSNASITESYNFSGGFDGVPISRPFLLRKKDPPYLSAQRLNTIESLWNLLHNILKFIDVHVSLLCICNIIEIVDISFCQDVSLRPINSWIYKFPFLSAMSVYLYKYVEKWFEVVLISVSDTL